jgi:hypothetical protein
VLMHAPLVLVEYDDGPLSWGHSWTINDEAELARWVAMLLLGQWAQALEILRAGNGDVDLTTEETVDAVLADLAAFESSRKNKDNRDGWLFQMISWLAARTKDDSPSMPPHEQSAHKGFDGIFLGLNQGGELEYLTVCEDKATVEPRDMITSKVWNELKRIEKGKRNAALISCVTGILGPEEVKANKSVKSLKWLRDLHYRIAVTIDTNPFGEKERKALFKGFDGAVPGMVKRRCGQTLYIQDIRDWFEAFTRLVKAQLLDIRAGKCTIQ